MRRGGRRPAPTTGSTMRPPLSCLRDRGMSPRSAPHAFRSCSAGRSESLLGLLLQDPFQHGVAAILEFCPRRNDLAIGPNEVLAAFDKSVEADRIAEGQLRVGQL